MKRSITFFNLAALITTLLNLSGQSNEFMNSLMESKRLNSQMVVETQTTALTEEEAAAKLSELGVKLHPGTDFESSDPKPTESSLNHCKSLVYKTLASLPPRHASQLKNLTLYFSDSGRRGLGGGSTIILRCQNVTDEELISVLVHEMGHVVDTGSLQGSAENGASGFVDGTAPVYSDDPSAEFYSLSFKNENTLRDDMTDLDFVSGYSKSDVFEDFAESYAYYVLHGNEFRELAYNNGTLAVKYDFLKNKVFNGKEYFTGDEQKKVDVLARNYDVTILPYNMKSFLAL
ncbi:hypothetical protein IT413_03775 [Candidatus Peregrinibacteria bacterium]|nr:hypothetical protein [Candidatus Peregrinibacteria bacterium]